MIVKIYANDKRFRPITFEKGLNVILADRKLESDDKDSRNGIGKTTLINIIHFCLGSDLSRKVLPVDDIAGWVFFFEIELYGQKVTASRSIANAGAINIQGDTSSFPIKPEIDDNDKVEFYKLAAWRDLLGKGLFGIESSSREKYTPSFRTLISYFARAGLDAYSKPFSYFRNQKSWQMQVANSFLLGLKWEHASDVQILKDKNNVATALNDAINNSIILSKGELEAERVRLQNEVKREERSLSEFKVHPKYKELQLQANELTVGIQRLNNKNMILQRKLSMYEESIGSEKEPDPSSIMALYEEAGIHFGDSVKKTLEDTKSFHSEIVQNRKSFLKAEVSEIKNSATSNEQLVEKKTLERAEIMNLLQAHGALEDFTLLQKVVLEKQAKLESLKEKISDMQSMAVKKKGIKAARIEIDAKIQRDFEESRPTWEQAIDGFNKNSLALYNNSGNLIINTSEKGAVRDNAYSFDVEIPRSNSEGVGRMKIFCYDLMLVDMFSQKEKIDFLVHDSTMFDGVDNRQVAHALEHAHKIAQHTGFQYICAFNSDSIPHEDFSDEFDIENYVRLRLSDQRPEDTLLGFHFELTKKRSK